MPSPPGQDRSATVWDIRSWGGRARARRTAGEIAKCRPVGQNGAMRMITADRLGGILAGITGPGDGHGPRAVAPGSFATPGAEPVELGFEIRLRDSTRRAGR